MTHNDELIERARAIQPTWHKGMYGSPADMYASWVVKPLLDSLVTALEVKETWYADAHSLAIENAILRDRITALEAAAQSHHFAAGSL